MWNAGLGQPYKGRLCSQGCHKVGLELLWSSQVLGAAVCRWDDGSENPLEMPELMLIANWSDWGRGW